jgi:hypothetical protein
LAQRFKERGPLTVEHALSHEASLVVLGRLNTAQAWRRSNPRASRGPTSSKDRSADSVLCLRDHHLLLLLKAFHIKFI